VWGECVLPITGDTNTPYYFYANTNHPVPEGAWSLKITGQTTITLDASNSTLASVSDPSCVGSQPYWFVWGPVILNVGSHEHQFIGVGDGDGFVETGPQVAQGGLRSSMLAQPLSSLFRV
jgi:hypothetical protein